MIGEVGTARTALVPRGKVFVHGEIWDAVSQVNVAVGESVVIRSVDGLELRVEPIPAATQRPAISAPVS